MNPAIKKRFDFSRPTLDMPSETQDKEQGIDAWFCGVPIAYRKRRKSYNDITIRYRGYSGAATEYAKILDGSFRAFLFFFEFPDKTIICSTASIKRALENGSFTVIRNTDNETELAVIPLSALKYLTWYKDST